MSVLQKRRKLKVFSNNLCALLLDELTLKIEEELMKEKRILPQNNTEDPKVWLSQNDEIIDETLDPFPEAEDEYTIILKTEPRDANHINKDSTCQQPDSSQRYENKRMKLKRRSPSIEYSTVRSSTDTDFSTKEDEFDIYGKYIASQLRRMELEKALRVQLEIQSLVSEARISELSNEH